MKEDADRLVAYLRDWGLPLGTEKKVDALPETTPLPEVVRGVLKCGDLRAVRALPLWLSLVPDVPPLPPGWSIEDRRRVAYLLELAHALATLREEDRSSRDDSWTAAVTGIEPQPWRERVPLCESPAPLATPSMFGERWGIEEPMNFPEYAAFQRQYLDLIGREGCHATKA
jgi:hypothetical protein